MLGVRRTRILNSPLTRTGIASGHTRVHRTPHTCTHTPCRVVSVALMQEKVLGRNERSMWVGEVVRSSEAQGSGLPGWGDTPQGRWLGPGAQDPREGRGEAAQLPRLPALAHSQTGAPPPAPRPRLPFSPPLCPRPSASPITAARAVSTSSVNLYCHCAVVLR